MPTSDSRPWGRFDVLSEDERFKVKAITVLPGERLSYQRHRHRSEHWYVVAGEGLVVLDGRSAPIGPGSTVDIAASVAHRVANVGVDELVFVEVQRGDYFGEDDIDRLEDDYGRVETPSG